MINCASRCRRPNALALLPINICCNLQAFMFFNFFLYLPKDGVRVNAGAALGALCQVMTKEEVGNLVQSLTSKKKNNIIFSLHYTVQSL